MNRRELLSYIPGALAAATALGLVSTAAINAANSCGALAGRHPAIDHDIKLAYLQSRLKEIQAQINQHMLQRAGVCDVPREITPDLQSYEVYGSVSGRTKGDYDSRKREKA